MSQNNWAKLDQKQRGCDATGALKTLFLLLYLSTWTLQERKGQSLGLLGFRDTWSGSFSFLCVLTPERWPRL